LCAARIGQSTPWADRAHEVVQRRDPFAVGRVTNLGQALAQPYPSRIVRRCAIESA